jgi:sodium bicarbonate transporter 10
MDQQITAVIINRKENKLKVCSNLRLKVIFYNLIQLQKGCGYHLDLFVLSILVVICSFFGLPWFVAATVLAMTHVNSLKMVSETAAPGDKPQFLGVREQRVTQISIFVLCGLSIFFTSVLQRIPMPVLYGVFLYMGTSSLKGSQVLLSELISRYHSYFNRFITFCFKFFERILILFMPQKYQPDYIFLRHVRTRRVHLFTIIQIICFVMLWTIKSYKPTSISFPLMVF